MSTYRLIDTDTGETVATGDSPAEVLAATPYMPSDCLDGAETWGQVWDASRDAEDGIEHLVEGYTVERIDATMPVVPVTIYEIIEHLPAADAVAVLEYAADIWETVRGRAGIDEETMAIAAQRAGDLRALAETYRQPEPRPASLLDGMRGPRA